jgi:uncharacterized membrane protein YbaN (DUF454 family)
MRDNFKRYFLIGIGWLCIILAIIGAVLPLLPTTPFLILALACFSKSSPRFHRMLLNHKWFGPPLAQWEQSHTLRRPVKHKAMMVIIITFGVSIAILAGRMELQLMLAGLCLILLWFVSRLKESESPIK